MITFIKRFVPVSTIVFTDTLSSYVWARPGLKNPLSRLDSYGYLHFWVNQSERFVHEKFCFAHTNNVDRMWRSFRQSISNLRTLNIKKDKIDDYLNAFMFKSLAHKLSLREFTLKILKDYYDLNLLLKFQNEKPEIVPNMCKIEFSRPYEPEEF